MKKLLSLFVAFLLTVCTLVGCTLPTGEGTSCEVDPSQDKCQGSDADASLQDAYDRLVYNATYAVDFDLYTTVGTKGAVVTYESSNTDVLEIVEEEARTYAKVTSAGEDVKVTLTATITIGSNTLTKTFDITIKSIVFEEVTVAQAMAAECIQDTNVTITGVVVSKTVTSSKTLYYIADETGMIQAYFGSNELVIGDNVTLKCRKSYYYGAPQLVSGLYYSCTVNSHDNANPYVNVPTRTVADITQYQEANDPLAYGYYTVTGKLVVLKKADGYKYDYYTLQDTEDSSKFITCLNYSSGYDYLPDFDGMVVTLNIYVYDTYTNYVVFHSGLEDEVSQTSYRYVFAGTGDDITVTGELTDEQIMNLAKVSCQNVVASSTITEACTLTLPTSTKYGATITWATSNADVVGLDGVVTLPAQKETVTLTATITYKDATETVTLTLAVGETTLGTIADAKAAGSGAEVKFQGMVTALGTWSSSYGNGSFLVEDETGAMMVYRFTDATVWNTLTVGTWVEVSATLSPYNGMFETKASTAVVTVIEPKEWTNPTITSTADMNVANQCKMVEFELQYVSGSYASKGTLKFLDADGVSITAYINPDFDLTALTVTLTEGSWYTVKGWMSYNNGAQISQTLSADFVTFLREGEIKPVDPTTTTTIADAKVSGKESTIKGVVTVLGTWSTTNNTANIIVEDATGAVLVYKVSDKTVYDTLTVGTVVTVSGSMTQYNGLWELTNPVVEVVEAEAPKTTVVTSVADLVEANQGRLVELELIYVSGSFTGSNASISFKDANDTAVIVRIDVNYAYDNLAGQTLVAGATYNVKGWLNWYNGAQITQYNGEIFTFVSEPEGPVEPDPIVTIAESKVSGSIVRVQGVVTVLGTWSTSYNNANLIIEDATGALLVYRITDKAVYDTLSVGKVVVASGTMTQYNGLWELTSPVVEVVEEEAPKTTVVTSVADLTLENQGRLVELELIYVSGSFTGTSASISFKDANGTSVVVRIDVNYAYDNLAGQTLVAGATYTVKGWLNWYNAAQITQYDGNVFTAKGLTEEQIVSAVAAAAVANMKQTYTADFTLTVEALGYAISWESNNAAIVVEGAKATVVRPAATAEDAVVTLTYSFTVNEHENVGTVEVTVPKTVEIVEGQETEFTYDFTNIDGFSSWTSSYTAHTVESSAMGADLAACTFNWSSANKQGTNITDQPVSKAGTLTVTLTDSVYTEITSVSFTLTQWTTKTVKATIEYSLDGGATWVACSDLVTTPGVVSMNIDALPAGVTTVRLNQTASNQVGYASCTLKVK